MIKIICDRCGNIAETGSSYFVYYTGRSEADGCNLCKKCFDEFSCWMNNNPMVCAKCGREAKNYDDRLSELTAALHKAQDSRDWWSNQCNEIFKDCDALRNKVDEIMAHGSVR